MTNLLNTIRSFAARIALVVVGCVGAGLGLAAVALLAVFALALAGLALLAAPFVALLTPQAAPMAGEPQAAEAA